MDNTTGGGIEPTYGREQFAFNLKKMAKDNMITITLGQFCSLTEQAMSDNFSGQLKCKNCRISYHSSHTVESQDTSIQNHNSPPKHKRPRISRSATLISHR